MHKQLMGTPVPLRPCGSCTLCCKLLPVSEIGKKQDEWCKHVVQGAGCGIYKTRPESCRIWSCHWVLNPDLPDELKPRHCHIVFDVMTDTIEQEGRVYEVIQAWCDPVYPDAHREPVVRKYIEYLAKTYGLACLMRLGRARGVVIVPPGLNEEGTWLELESRLVPIDRMKGNTDEGTNTSQTTGQVQPSQDTRTPLVEEAQTGGPQGSQ